MINFSIITPTFNRAVPICTAIDSALAQTYSGFELIIVDDGSSDDTQARIESNYSKELSTGKIRLIRLPQNKGAANARNIGLKQATHPWIVYLDSDNTLMPNFLITVKDSILKNPGKQLFCCQGINKISRKIIGPHLIKRLNQKYFGCDMGGIIHSKQLFESLGGFDESVCPIEDTSLLITYQKNNHSIVVIDEPLYEYDDTPHPRQSGLPSWKLRKANLIFMLKHSSLRNIITYYTKRLVVHLTGFFQR